MKKSFNFKRIAAIMLVMLFAFAFSCTAFAAGETTDAQVAETSAEATSESSETTSNGLGLIAAAVVTGLAGIGGGLAIAAAAPAAIAATSEDPKSFGKSLIFVALGESIALFGVVISILILNKV